ncbi:hypothetical protein TNCT_53251 [Trichonephila clavata]|uniref:Uncharacterized protein n=1 Tax=Trichonephila clavata TaxID=2740835 RepID=A0A8X6KGV8_TRICU|nr:hypothetical protein TNCT_53251 [Trichonephila clavata]
MRLWPATSRSPRNSLANVRCDDAMRLFGRGASYKLGTEHGVLKHNCIPEMSFPFCKRNYFHWHPWAQRKNQSLHNR